MIIGTAVTQGYQVEIGKKFYDCWGHLHITSFLADPGSLLNDDKFERDINLENKVKALSGVKSMHPYSLQSAILKPEEDMEGVVLKGLQLNEAYPDLDKYLIQGSTLSSVDSGYSSDILISESMANKLKVKVNEKALIYVVDRHEFQPRARKVNIKGIYKTGLEDYDKLFVLCDNKLIHNLNKEPVSLIQGYEISLTNRLESKSVEKQILDIIKPPMDVYPIEKRFASVFSWLGMMKMNETIIISIMMVIAFINMITAILILILERIHMIGTLKCLGMSNGSIRIIFLYTSAFIVFLGILFGLVGGIGLSWLQQHFQVLKMDETVYFVKAIPIYLNPWAIAGIVLSTFILCVLLLFIPSILINKISPTKAVQFR